MHSNLIIGIKIMTTHDVTENNNQLDSLKWAITILLLTGIVVGNYYYGETVGLLVRVAVILVIAAIAVVSASLTEKGRTFIEFAKDAKTEVRKVVWPTRQETTQTTLIILVVSTVVGLILWGLDGIFVRIVEFITTAI